MRTISLLLVQRSWNVFTWSILYMFENFGKIFFWRWFVWLRNWWNLEIFICLFAYGYPISLLWTAGNVRNLFSHSGADWKVRLPSACYLEGPIAYVNSATLVEMFVSKKGQPSKVSEPSFRALVPSHICPTGQPAFDRKIQMKLTIIDFVLQVKTKNWDWQR